MVGVVSDIEYRAGTEFLLYIQIIAFVVRAVGIGRIRLQALGRRVETRNAAARIGNVAFAIVVVLTFGGS